jgi:hypothetical protein
MKNTVTVLFILITCVNFAQDSKVLNSLNNVSPEDSGMFFKNLLTTASLDYHNYKSSDKRLVFIPTNISKENFDTIVDADKAIVIDMYIKSPDLKLKSIKGSFDTMFALWKTYFNNEAIKKTIAKDYKNQSIKTSTCRFTFKKAFDGSWTIQNLSN